MDIQLNKLFNVIPEIWLPVKIDFYYPSDVGMIISENLVFDKK